MGKIYDKQFMQIVNINIKYSWVSSFLSRHAHVHESFSMLNDLTLCVTSLKITN